jgi:two-component system sensor histidine kinase BarA
MKQNIKRIPLLFLFLPTILVAIALFITLNTQHKQTIEHHLKNNAKHYIYHIGEMARQRLYHKQYGKLKQSLWEYTENTDSGIDNIIIYDSSGQFVTALRIDEQILSSKLDDFSATPFSVEDDIYYAHGAIDDTEDELKPTKTNGSENIVGYVRVVFVAQSVSLTTQGNVFIASMIIAICLILSFYLWRYRYGQFHQQLGQILTFVINQNKGYKQGKLTSNSFYFEINQLQKQLNTLVGFYEKRLTMKQFEVSALEQSLNESRDRANEQVNAQLTELDLQQTKIQQQRLDASDTFRAMYRVVFQRLQERFAVIEHAIHDFDSHVADSQHDQGQTIWPEKATLIDAANQLNLLLCEVKRLADAASGSSRQPVEYISLAQLISSISHFVIPVANQKSLEFVVCQPDHPIDIELDVNHMQQVLIALMQSAVASSNKGYIKLTVEVLPLSGKTEHGELELLSCKIQDSGCGLNDHQLAMLVDNVIDAQLAEDSWLDEGLRLMVAKTMLANMGGELNVKSLSGLGTEVTVSLKCKVSHSSAPDLRAYNGCDIVIYDPVSESGNVIYEKLCEHGMLAVLCLRLGEVEALIDKSQTDCLVLNRPVEAESKAVFDQSVEVLINSGKIARCLVVSAEPELPFILPPSWLLVEKPFVLTALLDYFHPSLVTEGGAMAAGELKLSVVEQAKSKLTSSNKINLLAVDDNETNLKLLSIILGDYPVELTQALSGREALALSQQQAFDLILMDKEMPQMSGLETSLNIRQLTMNQNTPIVMFSAHVDDEERASLLEQDINGCIEKPLDQVKFYALMEQYCLQRWLAVKALADA